MIPILLTIEGLYSYRQKQTVVFDQLNKARLFGVFGAVGSGKSSLLEAITLALYGQCERLDNRDNKNYNLMNLVSQKLYISFEFEHSGKKFQYNYGNKRNSKNYDDVKSPERSAFEWENENWKPLPSSDAENILGLSYDNFRRTIIIPQGKFQEFLQLGDAERTRMVKDMFSLERFEFSYKTDQLLQKTHLDLAGLTGNLLELEQYSEEAESKLQLELQALIEMGKIAKQQLVTIVAQFDQLNEALKLDTIWKEKKLINETAQTRVPELSALTQKLKSYKNAHQTFAHDLMQSKKLNAQFAECEKKLADQVKQISLLEFAVNEHQLVLQNHQKNKKENTVWIKEKAELLQLAEVKLLIPRQMELLKKYEQAKSEIENLNRKLETSETDEQKNEQLLLQYKGKLTQKEALNEWLYWFDLNARFQKQHDDQLKILRLLGSQLAAIVNQQTALLAQENIKQSNLLDKEIRSLNLSIIDLTTQKDHLLTLAGLEKYASTLHDGEPCPLCGAEEHPHIINSDEAQKALVVIELSIKQSKEQYEKLLQIEKKLVAFQIQSEGLAKQEEATKQQIVQIEFDIENQKKQLPKTDFGFENAEAVQLVLAELNAVERLFQSLTEVESQRKQTSKTLLVDKESKQKLLLQIQLDQQTVDTKLDELNKHWEIIQPESFTHSDATDLRKMALQLEADQTEIANKMVNLEREIKQKEQDLAMQMGSKLTQIQTHQTIQVELESLNATLQIKLVESEFNNWQDVERLLISAFQADEAEQKINALQLSIQKAEADFKEADQKARQNPHIQSDWEAILQTKTAQEEMHINLRGEYKAKKIILDNSIEKREKAKVVREQAERLKVRLAYLNEFKNLFKASGFVRFVSQVFLENLCKQADHRFQKLTRHQLSLELDDKLNFVVRDFLHNGQVRSVKTLSGGQTFQASLSLALALSDSFNQFNAEKGHFFFMDEGFGSLDSDSLRVVFDALQELRFENRIVGVISHLEELQKEIETYIKVTNTEDQGSVIAESWV